MIHKFISILIILLSFSCSKNEVQLSEFIRQNIPVNKIIVQKSILIGDSNVSSIKLSNGFGDLGVKVGPNKVGITTKGLSEIVKKTTMDESVTKVFVAIGTNDAYHTNDSKMLMSCIRMTYPNVEEVWVIWGSVGWGSNVRINIDQVKKFYQKFNENGFKIIEIENNYFRNDVDAHRANAKYQIEIIKKIKERL